MNRLVLSLVALAALFLAVDTARADWVYVVSPSGWYGWEWDPNYDDGSFLGNGPRSITPTKAPPTNYLFMLNIGNTWYAIVGFI